MFRRSCFAVLLVSGFLNVIGQAAPVIDPLPNVTIPAGKSLTLPITATSPGGQPIKYTITSNTNRIGVVMHTNNPFWQLSVAQAAASNAPGAYQTPYRGGMVTVTNVGTMTFLLFPEYAPHTINVFQGLTAAGYFNSNTIFHRVITNFVIQGGDPNTNGSGGTSFYFNDELHPQALFTGNGQLALANAAKNANDGEFFVTVGPQRAIDFQYTIFGQLVRGFEVLTNLNHTAVDANNRPLSDEIIQLAYYVTNTTDTVLTLTASNVAKITGKITVVADAGAGGKATNTFNAVTITDTNSNSNPLIYPDTVTNLVVPKNRIITNYMHAVGLEGEELYWFPAWNPPNALTNLTGSFSNSVYKSLTYNVTNKQGELAFYMFPTNGYVGPVSVYFDVSSNPDWLLYFNLGLGLPPYDEQYITFIFGDTPITGQSNNVLAAAGRPFSGALLATFTNGVANSSPTNFAAYINWGDNAITTGTVTTNSSGKKIVLGAHTYTFPGVYPVYTLVQSSIGAGTTILSYITVLQSAPELTFSGASALGPNGFSFSMAITTGLTGSIQFSTNLQNWTTLTNFNATNSPISFRDPGATNSVQRYYRAVVP